MVFLNMYLDKIPLLPVYPQHLLDLRGIALVPQSELAQSSQELLETVLLQFRREVLVENSRTLT